ncbi:lipopolysaccharide assembly protein LapB [Flavobacterium sp. LC2016-12]|uniref:tetratricopeptide repeat protein n=1 Tax=Flavobacterium sp. LC2016-12 TaxID=2783794 RepID=UPI00188B3B0F|nr:tetratricopeptide repeat protein [Flavobacterium sp. LC2016-12]MBF4464569.1 tetratricopeptide repeat protein [Flavobacterium sp. LC2016-12]
MFSITPIFLKTISTRFIICLLFFFVFNPAFAQQKSTLIEDDYETLKHKIRLYFNSSDNRAMMYAEQMAKSSNYEHLAFANGAMAVFFQTKGNTKESQKRYKKALYYLEKMPESHDKIQMKSYVYNYGGIAEWTRGNYSKALENYQTGLKFSNLIHDVKQIVKIEANIALLNEAVGNYQLTINHLKHLNDFVAKNEEVFTKDELLNYKSNNNYGLGRAYESYFIKNVSKKYLLDSAEYYYKKTINYSQNPSITRISAELSLGNVYNWKLDHKSAEKIYYDVLFLAQQNDLKDVSCVVYYNLGDIYHTIKKYDKALVYFKKCESLAAITKNNTIDYLKSNFYQAKIYTILKQSDLAYKHSKIYLDNYEKYEAKISKEALEVNYKQGNNDLTADMLSIEKKYKKDLFLNRVLTVFCVLLFLGISFLLIRNVRAKNKALKNMDVLIAKSKTEKVELSNKIEG